MFEKARVVSDPKILSGTPVIKGTRVPADNVLVEVRNGTPLIKIFAGYPTLPPDAVAACVEWDKAGRPL